MKAPKVVTYNLINRENKPFEREHYITPIQEILSGHVKANGEWAKKGEPAAGWKVSKKDIGKYLIEHYKNIANYSVNVTLIEVMGKIKAHSLGEMGFEVHIQDVENNYMDKPFMFSVSFIKNSA